MVCARSVDIDIPTALIGHLTHGIAKQQTNDFERVNNNNNNNKKGKNVCKWQKCTRLRQ